MPGKIKVVIIKARNLPIMDRSSDSSDAFVEVRFGANYYDKTHVCKKTLDPEWNSRFVFEVEEDEIQEEPLQIRVLDHDTYSSHDAIGKVYIDLKPLLSPNGPSSIYGWLPLYDTMHGIRGEIKVQIKVEIFTDCNEYRKSSSGVEFFSSSKVPDGYLLEKFCGFVEELVINDDPEYQWIDKIRTPRTSNETRQKLFSKLSGELQRRIGLKVLDMDANCVIGYLQNFELEGEHGIVVRGIGTAAYLTKQTNQNTLNIKLQNHKNSISNQTPPISSPNTTSPISSIQNPYHFNPNNENSGNSSNSNHENETVNDKSKVNNNNNNNTINNNQANANGINPIKLCKISPSRIITRIHSDSDINSYHAAQQQLANLTQPLVNLNTNLTHGLFQQPNENQIRQSSLEKMEYPFLTIQQYPAGFVKSISGIVCARSVKLLDTAAEMEPDARDKWWIEIRNEIRSHMKSLNCHAVIGYNESKSICEDVCVLSASGTAAIIDDSYFIESQFHENNIISNENIVKTCRICHIPYQPDDLPFPVTLYDCNSCSTGQVPDVIFTTIQPLPEIEIIGQGCLLRAIVTRPRKKSSGEMSAKIISDYLPFMEYELHNQLLGKLKLKGMNMLYGLRIQISLGENLLIGVAEATACYAACLPIPMIPRIISEKTDKSKKELEEIDKLKKLINEEVEKNKEFFNLNKFLTKNNSDKSVNQLNKANTLTNTENQDLFQTASLLSTDSKAVFKIELDDIREKDAVYLLLDSDISHKKGFYTCATEFMPGINKFNENIQFFNSVYRCETSLVQMNSKKFNEICDEILLSLHSKFSKIAKNICLTNLSFDNSLYDDDHAMIIITGCCQTFTENEKSTRKRTIDYGVEITNLSYVPNTRIESYLGNINLFLIRESTQIKENGGLSGFMHSFFTEVLSLTRAHVKSLGGNALVSYKMNECVLLDNPHKNQGQALISIAGDVVKVNAQL